MEAKVEATVLVKAKEEVHPNWSHATSPYMVSRNISSKKLLGWRPSLVGWRPLLLVARSY